jgi:hypothetical protein
MAAKEWFFILGLEQRRLHGGDERCPVQILLDLGFTGEHHHSLSVMSQKWPDQQKAEYRDSLKNGSTS